MEVPVSSCWITIQSNPIHFILFLVALQCFSYTSASPRQSRGIIYLTSLYARYLYVLLSAAQNRTQYNKIFQLGLHSKIVLFCYFILPNCIKYVVFFPRKSLLMLPLDIWCIWRAHGKCKLNFLTNFVFYWCRCGKVSVSHFIGRAERIKEQCTWIMHKLSWNTVPLFEKLNFVFNLMFCSCYMNFGIRLNLVEFGFELEFIPVNWMDVILKYNIQVLNRF